MFVKNDNSFTCINCNNEVKKLTFSNMLAHVLGDWVNVLR